VVSITLLGRFADVCREEPFLHNTSPIFMKLKARAKEEPITFLEQN